MNKSALLFALLSGLSGFTILRAADLPARPNIVFILADDLGWGDLSCHGHPWIKTPHIDALAHNGTDFQQFTVANPVCSASRTGFMTGRYPARFSVHEHFAAGTNQRRNMPDWLDPHVTLVTRLLRDAGYVTGHYGKWHLTNNHTIGAPYPDAYGIDDWAVFNGPGDRSDELPYGNTGRAVSAFIRAHRDRPFLVNAWLHEPHTPHVPTQKSMARHRDLPHQEQVYAAVLSDADDQVGEILQALRDAGVENNTIVIFSSDNGPENTGPAANWWFNNYGDRGLGTYYSVGSAAGMSGHKRELYEGGIRTPFIVRWPGHTPAGSINNATVITAVDLLPTFCAAAQVPLPGDYHGDGENLLASFEGRSPVRQGPIFWEWKGGHQEPRGWPALGVREADWKLLVSTDDKRLALFNLATDRAERNDVAATHPDIVRHLHKIAVDWRATLPAAPDPIAVSPDPAATDPTAQ